MTPTEIIAAFDAHLPPDIAERAKRAYEKVPFEVTNYEDIHHLISASFLWDGTDEGWSFWTLVMLQDYDAARALLQPDYKEMWEAADSLLEKISKMKPVYYKNLISKTDEYNHYQTLKQKHNGEN